MIEAARERRQWGLLLGTSSGPLGCFLVAIAGGSAVPKPNALPLSQPCVLLTLDRSLRAVIETHLQINPLASTTRLPM